MARGIKFWLSLALLFFANNTFANGQVVPPSASSDLEKLDLLLAIHNEFPPLLSNAPRFGFDPFAVLDDDQRLLSMLVDNPEYRRLMENRPPYLDISIRNAGPSEASMTAISPEQVRSWREGMLKTLSEYPDPQESLLETLRDMGKRNPTGLINGVINSLPQELKPEAFRQPGLEAKIAFLRALPELPESSQSLVNEAEQVSQLESRLSRLTELSIALQTQPGVWAKGDEATRKISALSEMDLNQLLDYPHYTEPRFKALNEDLKLRRAEVAVKATVVDSIVKGLKRRASDVVKTQAADRALRLQELSPLSGVFRGCAGGDCSTSMSFAAPNNPDELVFHVTGKNGVSKGYVEATRVLVEGKPTLYVSSINGPRISSGEVEMILQGLYQERELLRVEQLALPTQNMLTYLINYPQIRGRFLALTQYKPSVAITHTSPAIRSEIEDFESDHLTADYDDMANNGKGVLYSPPANTELGHVEAVAVEKPLPSFLPDPARDRSKMLRFVVDMDQSGNYPSFSERAGRVLAGSDENWQAFKNELSNSTHKPLAKYKADLGEAVKSILGKPDVDLIDEKVLVKGLLNARDAFTPENFDSSLQLISRHSDEKPLLRVIKVIAAAHYLPIDEKKTILSTVLKRSEAESLKDREEVWVTMAKTSFQSYGYGHGPEAAGMKDLIRELIMRDDRVVLVALVKNVFSRPRYMEMKDLLDLLIRHGDRWISIAVIKDVFSTPGGNQLYDVMERVLASHDPGILREFIESGSVLWPRPLPKEIMGLIRKYVRPGDQACVWSLKFMLSTTHNEDLTDLMRFMIERGYSETRSDLEEILRKDWKNNPNAKILLRASRMDDAEERAAYLEKYLGPIDSPLSPDRSTRSAGCLLNRFKQLLHY